MNALDLQLLTNTLINFFTNHSHLLPNYVPDSKKVSILLWRVKNQPNTFMLKIANQKYISDYRIDKNGEAYWKFKEAGESEVNDPSPNSTPPSSEAVAKFQNRQAKTEAINTYDKPSSNQTEQSVNNS